VAEVTAVAVAATLITVTVITKTGTKNIFKAPVTGLFLYTSSIKFSFMDRFSKQITVGNEQRLFEFTRLENINGVKFFITSVDENKKPFSFSVRRKDANNWRLLPGSQRWLYEIEEELSNAISETRLK
jgi:hypothetical protein